MMVDSLDGASNFQATQHVENVHTTTRGTEAISGNLQETIQSLQTKLKMLSRAVTTNHDWLLQDAEHRADMIIMARQQTAEGYCSALFAREQIEHTEALSMCQAFSEACDDATRKLQAIQAEVSALQEQLRADLAAIKEVFEAQTATAIKVCSHHTL